MENTALLAASFAGLMAGAIHVLAGPDHLAAVAPLSIVQPRRPWLAGVRWGVGHATGVLLVAVAAWLVREVLPIESISGWSERLVGVMLLMIGFWAMRKALRGYPEGASDHSDGSHPHDHGSHGHDHRPGEYLRSNSTLLVGILHGCAGSAHFFGVLPALGLPTKSGAAAYLLAFSVGTVAAMAGFSWGCGLLGQRVRVRGTAWYRGVMVTCASGAIVVGGVWLAM